MDPRIEYRTFYENGLIERLAPQRRWSISTRSKKPIDMGWLRRASGNARHVSIDFDKMEAEPPGARMTDPTTMMTLDELTDFVPDAPNVAYYLDAWYDDMVLLDVEPHARSSTISRALALDAPYREVSMSGHGFHMLFETPNALFERYPNAVRSVIKQRQGEYELHLRHWVTFTRITEDVERARIAREHRNTPSIFQPSEGASFEKFITPLLRVQDPLPTISDIPIDPNTALTDDQADLVEWLVRQPSVVYRRTPSDFDNDMSRWEFGYIAHIYAMVCRELREYDLCGHHILPCVSATPADAVMMTYCVAKRVMPYRQKHATTRRGLPWLLWDAQQVAMRSTTTES